MNGPQKIIRIENGTVGYPDSPVLEGVNLTLEEGGRYLLSGPNGGGKTTLMRTLLGLLPLLSGKKSSTFENIGYVPQTRDLDHQYPLTVEASLHCAFYNPFPGSKERKKRHRLVEDALRSTGMNEKKYKLLRECSGGELQRTLIARSLVFESDFLALDEPTSSIDKTGKEDILSLVRGLHEERNLTILITTHETTGKFLEFFDNFIHIEDGRVILEQSNGVA